MRNQRVQIFGSLTLTPQESALNLLLAAIAVLKDPSVGIQRISIYHLIMITLPQILRYCMGLRISIMLEQP